MRKDITEQAALVRSGEVSAVELVEAAIAALEGARELNVLVHEQFESARAAAAGPLGDGPLAGVPFLRQGPRRASGRGAGAHGFARAARARRDRDSVDGRAVSSAAGLIICGRTNTPEFGNHCATEPALFGPTLNPWDASLSPGGSSGGSAAAVAAGLVGAASGSDGTGSIRMPSSCCGLVGLKPRRGPQLVRAVRRDLLDGLANNHALTRTVRDSALLLDVIGGSVPGIRIQPHRRSGRSCEEVGADPGRLRVMR